MPNSKDKNNGLKFYGRRKGKTLRPSRLDALDTIYPSIKIDHTNPPTLANYFPFTPKAIWLEIGFGDGEHLLYQALQNPDVGLIGCEPFINGIAALCKGIKAHNLHNIRIFGDDARLFMPTLPDNSIDRCFILNSDPWPKTRHAKRRFIQKETLDELHRLLKPNAPFRMSSDHPLLAAWQLEKTYFHEGFEWQATCAADWRNRPIDLPETRYQNKGAAQGRPTVFLDFLNK